MAFKAMKRKVRYHFSPITLGKIKKPNNTKCWETCEENNAVYMAGRNVNIVKERANK